MEPITHKLKTSCKCGKACLDTYIAYTFIDGSLSIKSIDHRLNDSFTFSANQSDYLHYLMQFGREMITQAERDIEHMKEVARRHDDWLRDELNIIGATA
jgi:hypothetical protein